jgi:NTP pyrophosphatase (non-canonical NTP hydrolase)
VKIKDLVNKAHENARNKGFWDKFRPISELLMLVVAELAEALEADRENRFADWNNFIDCKDKDCYFNFTEYDNKTDFECLIKDTFEDEIADCFIRLADLCGGLNIDIEKYIEAKMEYNKSREILHGKKY